MAAPKGNQNAKGHKGAGGRPAAIDELLNAQWHVGLWEIDQQVLELQEKLKSRVYSGRDVFALQVLTGKERAVKTLADKMLPDLAKVEMGGEGFAALEALLIAALTSAHGIVANKEDRGDDVSE